MDKIFLKEVKMTPMKIWGFWGNVPFNMKFFIFLSMLHVLILLLLKPSYPRHRLFGGEGQTAENRV